MKRKNIYEYDYSMVVDLITFYERLRKIKKTPIKETISFES